MSNVSAFKVVHENDTYKVIGIWVESEVGIRGINELEEYCDYNNYLVINKRTNTIEAQPNLFPEAVGLANSLDEAMKEYISQVPEEKEERVAYSH